MAKEKQLIVCPRCHGKKTVKLFGFIAVEMVCPLCEGEGEVVVGGPSLGWAWLLLLLLLALVIIGSSGQDIIAFVW